MRKIYNFVFGDTTLIDWIYGILMVIVVCVLIAVSISLYRGFQARNQQRLEAKASWLMVQYPNSEQVVYLFAETTPHYDGKNGTTYWPNGWEVWQVRVDGTSFLVRCVIARGEYICTKA